MTMIMKMITITMVMTRVINGYDDYEEENEDN